MRIGKFTTPLGPGLNLTRNLEMGSMKVWENRLSVPPSPAWETPCRMLYSRDELLLHTTHFSILVLIHLVMEIVVTANAPECRAAAELRFPR